MQFRDLKNEKKGKGDIYSQVIESAKPEPFCLILDVEFTCLLKVLIKDTSPGGRTTTVFDTHLKDHQLQGRSRVYLQLNTTHQFQTQIQFYDCQPLNLEFLPTIYEVHVKEGKCDKEGDYKLS